MKKVALILMFSAAFNCFSQNTNESLALRTGFNRVGFYNSFGFVGDIKNHQINVGLRHYTLDNFFEKNTIGLDLGYQYLINAKNEKFYFYPGISTSFFRENKTQAIVYLTDLKLINGVGINLNEKWSLNYQLGVGVLFIKSNLYDIGEVNKIEYYNYEMSFGINYRFRNSSEL
jgi:hypothetical protein